MGRNDPEMDRGDALAIGVPRRLSNCANASLISLPAPPLYMLGVLRRPAALRSASHLRFIRSLSTLVSNLDMTSHSLNALKRWSCNDNDLPSMLPVESSQLNTGSYRCTDSFQGIDDIHSLHVYDFDNTR